MANSSIVRIAKNKIIKEFIKDPDIIAAINSSEIKSGEPEKLINKHIFNYNQNLYHIIYQSQQKPTKADTVFKMLQM